MTLHDELREAATAEVVLGVGQNVIVKTKAGAEVTRGTIIGMEPDMKVVRVADVEAGADVQVDVDCDRYDILVLPAKPPMPLKPSERAAFTRIGRAWFWRWT